MGAVIEWLEQKQNQGALDRVVFNTFTDVDHAIYLDLAGQIQASSS